MGSCSRLKETKEMWWRSEMSDPGLDPLPKKKNIGATTGKFWERYLEGQLYCVNVW